MSDNEIAKRSPKRTPKRSTKKKGRPTKELAVPLLANPDKPIRSLNQTTDLAAFFAYHMAAGNLTTGQSREIRHWVDLMMTSIIAQKAPEENTSSSVIHVLHSLANQAPTAAPAPTPTPTIDIPPATPDAPDILRDEEKAAI